MAFDPSRLYSQLLNTGLQITDNALYQVIRELITVTSKLTISVTALTPTTTSGVTVTGNTTSQLNSNPIIQDVWDAHEDINIPGPQGIQGSVGPQGPPGILYLDEYHEETTYIVTR